MNERYSSLISTIRGATPLAAPSVSSLTDWAENDAANSDLSLSATHPDPDIAGQSSVVRYAINNGYSYGRASVWLNPGHTQVSLTSCTVKLSLFIEADTITDLSFMSLRTRAGAATSSDSVSLLATGLFESGKLGGVRRVRWSFAVPVGGLSGGLVDRLEFDLRTDGTSHGAAAVHFAKIEVYANHIPLILWSLGDDTPSDRCVAVANYMAANCSFRGVFWSYDAPPANANTAALLAGGHELACHTSDTWTSLDAAGRLASYNAAVARMAGFGQKRTQNVLASGGGGMFLADDAASDDWTILPGLRLFRTSASISANSNTRGTAHNLPWLDAFWGSGANQGAVQASLDGAVTTAKTYGQLVSIGIHDFPADYTRDACYAHLDALQAEVNAGNVRVVQLRDLLAAPGGAFGFGFGME